RPFPGVRGQSLGKPVLTERARARSIAWISRRPPEPQTRVRIPAGPPRVLSAASIEEARTRYVRVSRKVGVTTPVVRRPGPDPFEVEQRFLITFGGCAMAGISLIVAWLSAAGVQTSPFDSNSGPTLSTLLLLAASIGLAALGA